MKLLLLYLRKPASLYMYSIAFHPKYAHPVPEHHRFPMAKYELLPQQLLYQGIVKQEQFFEPRQVALRHVYSVHDKSYVDSFVNLNLDSRAARRIGFIQDSPIVTRELLLVQGTIDGAVNALKDGIAFNIAGGTHHACKAHGEGFCMLNDQAIAAQYLIDHTDIQKVLIVDLDVHQGNGTADVLHNHPQIFTFSMHCQSNYPFHKKQSHKDIGLPDGTDDSSYLSILSEHLSSIIASFKPEFIFYQAGVDIIQGDKMGKLGCSIEGCKARDRFVFEIARQHNIPVQCSMGGGYAQNIQTILNAHTNTYIAANEVWGV